MRSTLIFIIIGIAAVSSDRLGKILGGRRIKINKVPYQVALIRGTKIVQGVVFEHICGGSIISPDFILTAGKLRGTVNK